MLQILNPYFESPTEKKATQQAATLDAWLKTQSTRQVITTSDLKAAFPAADLSREVLNQICANLGLKITNPSDSEE